MKENVTIKEEIRPFSGYDAEDNERISKYKCVWNDEFLGDELNSSNWSYLPIGGGPTNMVTFADNPELVSVSDSILKLTAKKDGIMDWKTSDGKDVNRYITSKMLHTDGKMGFRHGYIELCAKFPFGKDVWPAFWCLSKPQKNDYLLEIDIAEIMNSETSIGVHIHKWIPKENAWGGSKKIQTTDLFIKNADLEYKFDSVEEAEQFHIYAFEWLPDSMRFYVDGKKFVEIDLIAIKEKLDITDFEDTMYLLIDNYLWITDGHGKPSAFCKEKMEFLIDYVRVFEV